MTHSIDHDPFQAAVRFFETRRSIRRYAAQAIEPAIIEQLLQCATQAPSSHNRQPWRFAVIRSMDAKVGLARAMGERLRSDRLRDGDALEAVRLDEERSFQRIVTAPVIVVAALSMSDMDMYPDQRRREAEHLMAVQSTATAIQNLMLAAHAASLGACWMCAPLFCQDTVRGVLALPGDWQPQAIISLGIPAMTGKTRARRPLKEVVRYVEAK